MSDFKITNMAFEEIGDFDGLIRINQSECDDFLSQLIFRKIDQYAYTMCGSLHNAIYGKKEILSFNILCLDDEINPKESDPETADDFENELNKIECSFNDTIRLFTPPNEEYKKIRLKNTPIKQVSIGGNLVEVCFNPYLIALFISDIYFTLYNDKRIEIWCKQGHIKFESIDNIFEIIKDKYSNLFIELTHITFKTLYEIVELETNEKISKLEIFYGFNGTDLLKHYGTWSNNFYNELLDTIKGLFGKLQYS